MAKCALVNCESGYQKSQPNLSFHRWPTNPYMQRLWSEAIGSENLKRDVFVKDMYVCSLHFKEQDFNRTSDVIRLRDDAVPSLFIKLCCRICLSTHRKLISMESHNLRTAYERLSGLSVQYDGLPRELCVECATLLLKYNKFRNKSHIAYDLLNNMDIRNYNYSLFQVDEIKNLSLELEKLHSKLKYSDLIVHLDIEPDIKFITNENSHKNYRKINCQFENNDLINKIKTIDSKTVKDDLDSEDSNIYNDDWTLTEFIDDTNDLIDDLKVHDSSDLSHIDEKKTESKELKSKKIVQNIKEVKPLETTDEDDNDTVDNDDLFEPTDEDDNDTVDSDDPLETTDGEDNDTVDNDDSSSDMSDIDERDTESYKEKAKTKNSDVKEVDTFSNNDKVTLKAEKKPKKLLALDGTSETPTEKLQKKNGDNLPMDFSKNNMETFQARHEMVKECFVEKTTLSLKEQRVSFKKMKRNDSYVKANYKCELCYKGFVTEQYLNKHNEKCHSPALGRYVCQICKVRYRIDYFLQKHMKRAHAYEYQCKSCNATFTNFFNAESHAKNHKGIKFVCEHCKKECRTLSGYMSHVRIQHPSDHICVYCGYSFIGENGLNHHIKKTHKERTDFKDVPCEHCELKFASEEALAIHMRVKHPIGNEKPLYNERIKPRDPSKKYVHKKIYYSKRKFWMKHFPIPCEACGLNQSSGKEYTRHFAREHPNLKRTFKVSKFYPHICDQCGRRFYAISVLKDHLLTHGSMYTMQCTQCDRKFKSRQQLKSHSYTHEEPIECHICGASITKPNMRKHLMKHSNVKSFKCELCGKCFKVKWEVQQHTKHVHMNIPWPRKRKDGPPLPKRKKVQRYTRESETEESNYSASAVSNDWDESSDL